MSWHYQARKTSVDGEPLFEVIEVYADDTSPFWTEDSMKPCGETKAELILDLQRMLDDVKDYPTFVEEEHGVN